MTHFLVASNTLVLLSLRSLHWEKWLRWGGFSLVLAPVLGSRGSNISVWLWERCWSALIDAAKAALVFCEVHQLQTCPDLGTHQDSQVCVCSAAVPLGSPSPGPAALDESRSIRLPSKGPGVSFGPGQPIWLGERGEELWCTMLEKKQQQPQLSTG